MQQELLCHLSSRLGEDAHETLSDLNCWGWLAISAAFDFPLDSGIDCGKSYCSSFIFPVGRGHAWDFVWFQLLGVTSDPNNFDFLSRFRLLSCEATMVIHGSMLYLGSLSED